MTEEERLREIIRRLCLYCYPLADHLGDICDDLSKAAKLAGIDLPDEWYEGPRAWKADYNEDDDWPSLYDDDLKRPQPKDQEAGHDNATGNGGEQT